MDGVVDWFERRGEIPLLPPHGVREYGPVTDDPDRFHPEFSFSGICGVAFAIDYCDSRGWMSTRTIRCLALNPHHPACLTAYCHHRDAVHTFRIDRIISLVDLRSGRPVTPDGQLALLAPYMPDSKSRTYLEALIALQVATRDGVFALLQLAMTDGYLSDAAREIILDYIMEECAAVGCRIPSRGLVELWIDNLAPPLEAVSASVRELLSERKRFARVMPYLLKVARAQDPFGEETESVRELIAQVREHFSREQRYEWSGDLRATN